MAQQRGADPPIGLSLGGGPPRAQANPLFGLLRQYLQPLVVVPSSSQGQQGSEGQGAPTGGRPRRRHAAGRRGRRLPPPAGGGGRGPPPVGGRGASAGGAPAPVASDPQRAAVGRAPPNPPGQQQPQQQQQPPPQAALPVYPITLQAMKQHKDHPLRMKLEWDEIERADEIKEAIHETPGLDDINDFWCAQYALICKDIEGNVLLEDVIQRAEAIQVFRQQYGIVDPSYQEGCRAIRRFFTLCPNFILSFSYDPDTSSYSVAKNPANMRAKSFTPNDVRDWMVGFYYLHLAISPDFQSIHKGPSVSFECKDMGWSFARHNMYHFQKAETEFVNFVPVDPFRVRLYNTRLAGVVFNTMRRAMLKLRPDYEKFTKKIEFGINADGIDSLLLVPNAATAQQRVLQNVQESLRLRFQNENRFRLGRENENYMVISPFTDDEVDAVFDARRELGGR